MTTVNSKIVDLINAKEGEDATITSLEYFPPRTADGVKNLYARMERMKTNLNPLFTDITWGAGGSTADLSMELAVNMVKTGHVANLHLTCTNMSKNGDPVAAVHDALQQAHDAGIRNIVALRGDPPAGEDEWTAAEGGFTCALDLVKYIRKEFGDDFGVSVAGYPEGHPNAISELKEGEEATLSESELARCSNFDGKTYVCKDEDFKKEMVYLKEKVDAGADAIITQMFFDVSVYRSFVKECRDYGINVPIIPGLMCINAYGGFKKMSNFCKTRVPKSLEDKMDSMKDDQAAVKAFGVEFGADVCKSLLEAGAPVLHFYTLNLEKVVYGITDELGITENLVQQSNESDAKNMVAVGSAWARVGDKVKSIYGQGVVKEIRSGSVAVIESQSWELAFGQRPTFYLQKGHYEKLY